MASSESDNPKPQRPMRGPGPVSVMSGSDELTGIATTPLKTNCVETGLVHILPSSAQYGRHSRAGCVGPWR